MDADSMMLACVAWLGTYMIHSTLFLGVAWLLTRQRMLRSPRLSERIWRLALFGGLLTASLQNLAGTRPAWATWILESEIVAVQEQQPSDGLSERSTQPMSWSSQPEIQARTEDEVDLLQTATAMGSTIPPTLVGDDSFEAPLFFTPASIKHTDSGSRAPKRAPNQAIGHAAHTQAASASSSPLPWKRLALGAWITAGGLGLVGFLWACSCLIARMSKRRRIVAGPLLAQLEKLQRVAGHRREVKLFASTTLEGPITFGWIRPRICLPIRALSDLSEAQQRSMLAHELAHVMRRDPLWFSLYSLMVRVLSFQPLNRLARRELLEGAELLCDDWAVRWTGQRLGLASCLTEVAQWIIGKPRHAQISAGMADHPSRLGVRVERLLNERRSPQPEARHGWWAPTALCLLALIACSAPGFSSTAPALEPAPASLTPAIGRSLDMPEPLLREFDLERSLLDDELNLLQLEIEALRAELSGSGHGPRFQGALQNADRRLQRLRRYQERLNELLASMQPTSTNPR